MSAICGFLNLDGRLASFEIGQSIMEKVRLYPSDTSEIWCENQFLLGCHFQWVTPESKLERLPYHDNTAGLTITADAIIDNRSELMQIFEVPSTEWPLVTDSQLILMAYKKWGEKCPVYLIGDYAFVIADQRKNELFCARDHVGKRTFYYTLDSNQFAFCTLMKPLLVLPGVEKKLNDAWIADFLAIPTVMQELDANHTVYKNIDQLLPAHIMIINRNGIKKQKYWDPLKLPKLKLKNDAEYDAVFREIFSEAVRCRTRSIGSVGIMLSGGLDSGAVACVAATQLQETGRTLKAYTSVPMEGYQEYLNSYFIADESTYIEALTEQYKNIHVEYCRSEGKNSLTDVDRFLSMLEQPYKALENLFWMDTIVERAAQDGCSVLLDGQFGNSTISYGDFYIHIYSLIRQGRFLLLMKEITEYCKLHKYSRKSIIKYLYRRFMPLFLQKSIIKQQGNENITNSYQLVQPDLASKYEVKQHLEKAGYFRSYGNYTLKAIRKKLMQSHILSQAASIETKFSLTYGIARRDPTRDKRVIEFCMRIPGGQFVRNGHERLIIRRAMTGIMPDKVRLNSSVKGMQSADWLQRISPVWSKIHNEILGKMQFGNIQSYINTPEVMRILESNKDVKPSENNEIELRLLLICLVFSDFLKDYEKSFLVYKSTSQVAVKKI